MNAPPPFTRSSTFPARLPQRDKFPPAVTPRPQPRPSPSPPLPPAGPLTVNQWQVPAKELRKAALNGKVEFITYCVNNNAPIQYYCTLFKSNIDNPNQYGNILHLAVLENRVNFIQQLIKKLQPDTIQFLLLQHRNPDMNNNTENPLHLAASTGKIEFVKQFLSVLSSPSDHQKPWLAVDQNGNTPCHSAVKSGNEDCALEILKMDVEKLSNTVNHDQCGLLYIALYYGLKNLALEILRSATSFSCSGFDGKNPLHVIPNCSGGQEICEQLLKLMPNLLKEKGKHGWSVLHSWGKAGKVWPLECLLKDEFIHLRKDVANLVSAIEDWFKENPLHLLAAHAPDEDEAVIVAKHLIETYKQYGMTTTVQGSSSSMSSGIVQADHQFPWSVMNDRGDTPLSVSLDSKCEKLAAYILSLYTKALVDCEIRSLIKAIGNGRKKVADTYLDKVDKERWHEFTDNNQFNALHWAPKCTEEFLKQLLEGNQKLLERLTIDGCTIIHVWMELNEVWPFKYLLQLHSHDQLRNQFIKLISVTDYDSQNNPFHNAIRLYDKPNTKEIVQLLVKAYKEQNPEWRTYTPALLPWFVMNKFGMGALHSAIHHQREQLALYILSLYEGNNDLSELLDYYEPHHRTLFLALQKDCFEVAKYIMEKLDKKNWHTYLVNPSTKRTVLHLASSCKEDKEFGRWVVQIAEEFIKYKDMDGKTPLDKAFEVGADWIIEALIEKDPEMNTVSWIEACKKLGNVKEIWDFLDGYKLKGSFNDHCLKYKNSPLHHIILPEIANYEEFLQIPQKKDLIINLEDDSKGRRDNNNINNMKNVTILEDTEGKIPLMNNSVVVVRDNNNINMMKDVVKPQDSKEKTPLSKGVVRDNNINMKDLINLQDSQGRTPLNKAVRDDNIKLAQTLIKLDGKLYDILYDKKDHKKESARSLLKKSYEDKPNWKKMCKDIEFDPRVKTAYFQPKSNLLDVRTTLSLVAALLATITFTAGFTLPGGLNENTGEAIMATKAAFLVFMISDTLAMCCSILVLICLIWSMVYIDSNKSLLLIDRSMRFLLLSLYSTIIAFMSGVFVVISPKSLWAAILVIAMSSLLGIAANKALLYKLLHNLIPSTSTSKETENQICSLELGKFCLCGGSSLHSKNK